MTPAKAQGEERDVVKVPKRQLADILEEMGECLAELGDLLGTRRTPEE